MRLLICAGGTGGGVYPALAVLQALTKESAGQATGDVGEGMPPRASPKPVRPTDVLWVGGVGSMEVNLVERAGVPFTAIPAAGVHGVGLRAMPGNLMRLGRGFVAARKVLRRFRPDALLFTGGYLAVPMAMAARLPVSGLPRPRSLLYVPDIEPGLALKTLTRFTDQVAVTAGETRAWLPRQAKVTVTGYPLRQDLCAWNREDARETLGLDARLPVLFVFGGSKGARSINRALLPALTSLLPEMQVLHITGYLDWPDVEQARQALPEHLSVRYHAYPYLHEEMGAALTLADLVVSRAGASILGELPYFGLPAILVPYPHAWRYQKVNASYLVDHGAAVLVEDEQISSSLLPVVSDLMQDERRRRQMRQAMLALSRPQAAECIADLLAGLALGRPKEGCETW